MNYEHKYKKYKSKFINLKGGMHDGFSEIYDENVPPYKEPINDLTLSKFDKIIEYLKNNYYLEEGALLQQIIDFFKQRIDTSLFGNTASKSEDRLPLTIIARIKEFNQDPDIDYDKILIFFAQNKYDLYKAMFDLSIEKRITNFFEQLNNCLNNYRVYFHSIEPFDPANNLCKLFVNIINDYINLDLYNKTSKSENITVNEKNEYIFLENAPLKPFLEQIYDYASKLNEHMKKLMIQLLLRDCSAKKSNYREELKLILDLIVSKNWDSIHSPPES